MVEQAEKFLVEYVYPPNPFTSRGYNCHISVHPAKNKIVYCSANVVILRSAEDLTKCEVFTEHKYETTVARFSPSGALVCSADVKGTVIIWETEGKHHIRKQYEYVLSGAVKDIAWTGDNQRIAAVGEGKLTFGKVFLLDTGSSVGEISQVSKQLNAVDIRPTKPYRLAAGGEENLVTYYEGPPFKYKKTQKSHTGFVNGLRFSPTGNFFVSVSHDKKIILYDAQTGDELKIIDHPGSNHEGAINFCDWFEDGNFFVTASNDKSVKVWHAEGNKCVKTLRPAKEVSIDDFQVGVGVLKNLIVSVSLSGAINEWKFSEDIADGELPFVSQNGHQSNVKQVVYNSLNHALISGDGAGRIIIWRNQIPSLVVGKQHIKNIVKLAESSDKNVVYSVSNDGFLKVIDIAAGRFVKEVELKKKLPVDLIADKALPSVCYVVFEDNEVDKFEDLELKQEISVPFTLSAGDINSKGTILALGNNEGFVHLVNVENGESLAKLSNYNVKITSIRFSSDDRLLAVGDSGYKLKLWDVEKKESLTDKLVYHAAGITSITFSPSDKFMLTTSMDNGFYIWSTETFERIVEAKSKEMMKRLKKGIILKDLHKSGVNCGTFDESGKVITCGNDNLIKVTKPLVEIS